MPQVPPVSVTFQLLKAEYAKKREQAQIPWRSPMTQLRTMVLNIVTFEGGQTVLYGKSDFP